MHNELNINNTEEAHAFGAVATPDQIKKLKELRTHFKNEAKQVAKIGTEEAMNDAMFHMANAQFMREALETAGYIVND